MLYLKAVHPIRRPDPPEGSDQTQPKNRPTRSSHRLEAGHLFQKPTPAGQSHRCTKNFQQKISRFRQKFPDFGKIFQIPASDFQIPTSNFQILVTKFHISATYQVDLVIFHPNLVKSHQIKQDLTRSNKISIGFGIFSPEVNYFGQIFTVDGSNRNNPVSDTKPTAPIRLPHRLATGQDFLNPILLGRSRVGHKPDPDQPVDTPTLSFRYHINKVNI